MRFRSPGVLTMVGEGCAFSMAFLIKNGGGILFSRMRLVTSLMGRSCLFWARGSLSHGVF